MEKYLRRNRRPLKTWNIVGFCKWHVHLPEMYSFVSATFTLIARVHSVQLFNDKLYEFWDFFLNSEGVHVGMWKNRYMYGWRGLVPAAGILWTSGVIYFGVRLWADSLRSTPLQILPGQLCIAGSGFSTGSIKKAEFLATKSETFF